MARDLKATLNVGIKVTGEAELKKLERWQIGVQIRSAQMAERAASRQILAAERSAARQARALERLERRQIGIQIRSARMAEQGANQRARAAERAAAREARAAEQAANRQRVAGERLERWKLSSQLRSARLAAKTPRELGGTWDSPASKGGGGGKSGSPLDRFLAFGSKLALTGYLVAGGFRTASRAVQATVGAYADFEGAMAQVRVKGGFDKATTGRLAAQARYMGRTSMFGPIEAAQSQIAMAASGMSEQQIASNMPSVLKFAQATGMDTQESADYLIETARQFGQSLDDPNTLNKIGGAIIAAANAATISERDLRQTLKYAGPISSLAGSSLEQTLAMAAVAGNAGIKGSQSGTGVRNLFSSFAKPKGGKLTDSLLSEIGLSRKDVMEGMKDVPSFLEVMDAKMKGKGFSQQKRVALSASLFGQYGMTTAAVLQKTAGTKADGLRNGLVRMIEEIQNGIGDLDRAAAIKGDTVEGRVARMNASFETLRITIGEKLAPVASQVLDDMTTRLRNWDTQVNNDPKLAANIAEMGRSAAEALPHMLELAGAAFKLMTYLRSPAEGYSQLFSKETAEAVNEYLGKEDLPDDWLEIAAQKGWTPSEMNYVTGANGGARGGERPKSLADFFFPDKVGDRQANTWRGMVSPAVPQETLDYLRENQPPSASHPGIMLIRVEAGNGAKASVVDLKPPSNMSVEVNQSVPP